MRLSDRLSRRRALALLGMSGAGALLAACSGAAPPTEAPAKPADKPAAAATTAPAAAAKEESKAAPPAAKPAESKGQVTIVLSGATGGPARTAEEKLHARFTETNPNIKINHLERPAGGSQNYHDYLVTVFSAKDASMDIASVDTGSNWPAEYAPAGWLEPIDDILPKAKQERLMPQMVYQSTFSGKIYAYPWFNDVGVFFVRKDLLDQAGKKVPETWQEMVETAKGIAKPPELWGHIPCYRKDEQLTCNIQEFMWSNNADMTDADGKITINTPPVIEAIQFMIDLIRVHKITPEGVNSMMLDEGRQIFTEGKSVFHRNWAYVWARVHSPESKIPGKVSMERLPKFGPSGTSVTNLGGWSWTVSSVSKYKDESKQAVAWLGELPQQIEKYLGSGNPPAHMDAYNDENLNKYPAEIKAFAGPYFKVSLTAKSRPRHAQYREISEIMQNETQSAILGQKTAKEAADNMAKMLAPILQGWKP
ncbi:MAG TPA: ABC transporter substrate-binding protein [Chloroflexota bacterium]|jgi:multiple sugar transport system substrate-binding protein